MTPWEKYLNKKKEKRENKRKSKKMEEEDIPSDVVWKIRFLSQNLKTERKEKEKGRQKERNEKEIGRGKRRQRIGTIGHAFG